jgi:hypothetical protein
LKSAARAVFLMGALGGAACGRSVVPGSTYDQPLLSFRGTISPTGGLLQAKRPIVGLLWTDPLQSQPDVPMPARWLESSVSAADDTFSVDVFRPPPPEAVVTIASAGGQSSQLAVAELVIVDDQNGDGTFQVSGPRATIADDELYLAGSSNVLTYVASPFSSPPTNSPLTLPGQSGYALVNYNCLGQISGSTNPVKAQNVELVLQPSRDFPDVRPCRASHGP